MSTKAHSRAYRLRKKQAGVTSFVTRDEFTVTVNELKQELAAMRDVLDRHFPSRVTEKASPPLHPPLLNLPSEDKLHKKETYSHSDACDVFWKAWPNKVDRKKAFLSLGKALKSTPLETILVGVATYVANKPPDRPWLNPTTFLNGARWLDEPPPDHAGQQRPTTNNGATIYQPLRDPVEIARERGLRR